MLETPAFRKKISPPSQRVVLYNGGNNHKPSLTTGVVFYNLQNSTSRFYKTYNVLNVYYTFKCSHTTY